MKLKNAVDIYLEFHQKKVKEKTNKYTKRLLEKNFSQLFEVECAKISPKMIFELVELIKSTSEAKKSLGILVNVFDYACVLDLIDNNPAARLVKFTKPHSIKNMNFVDKKDLPELLRKIKTSSKNPTIKNALLSIIYTAQRRREIVGAKWEEIDWVNKIWTIPAERMKMGIEHKIPISDDVLKILFEQKRLNSEYIFPSKLINKTHIHLSSPIILLYDLGYKYKQTLHGFRHIFSTLSNESGLWNSEIIEKQLSHMTIGIKGVYDKSQNIEQRAKMMSWYCTYINEIIR
ncbi:TPA: site-specific integrase [Pasteurella multocida]|nr:site-specific integrase [Pasteurella multocida]HDR0675403.1 site-specific integrase [Pasteurella multocida]HDR0677834.1 site-specific integrase [Pasteurella multocida]HDR0680996.1 site-specific integrase [Pasteurella multocida]HDR0681897.1 site-specific integrase [Pasteurella multocida]